MLNGDLPECVILCAAGEGTLRGAGEEKAARCARVFGVGAFCAACAGYLEP